jgi:hypothetical protein
MAPKWAKSQDFRIVQFRTLALQKGQNGCPQHSADLGLPLRDALIEDACLAGERFVDGFRWNDMVDNDAVMAELRNDKS